MSFSIRQHELVKYDGQVLINYGDFHTHTTYSLHGMSSPSEMVEAAIESGLKYIALTDHHMVYKPNSDGQCDYFNAKNQIARAYEINRSFARLANQGLIKVIPGYEYNLYTTENHECFVRDDTPHLRSIGYHTWYCSLAYQYMEEYIGEIEERLATKKYRIFVHPERDIDMLGKKFDNFDIDDDNNLDRLMTAIVKLCLKYGLIIECNNSSIVNPLNSKEKRERNIKRMKTWIRKTQLYGVNIVVNSDAHVKYDIGNCYEAFKLLEEMGVSKKRIVNFDKDMIENLIVPK